MSVVVRVTPQYHEKPWGGTRYAVGSEASIGEVWLADGSSVIISGSDAGRTLDELSADVARRFVGDRVRPALRGRFPLTIKIIDARDGVSVQVHPDSRTARAYEGPGALGKDEAWFVLSAPAGAEALLGTRPGVTGAQVAAAFGKPDLVSLLRVVPIREGDSVTILAGLVHAFGPGIMVYEVQEPSALTYRLFDWLRPPTPGRALDSRRALAAVKVGRRPSIERKGSGGRSQRRIAEAPGFNLQLLEVAAHETATSLVDNRSLAVVTTLSGEVELHGHGWLELMGAEGPMDTVIVPAASGMIRIAARSRARLLIARACRDLSGTDQG